MPSHERHEPGQAPNVVLCLRGWMVPDDAEDKVPDRPGRARNAEHLCGLPVGHDGPCACICGRTAFVASRGTEDAFTQFDRSTSRPLPPSIRVAVDGRVLAVPSHPTLAEDDPRRCQVRFQLSRVIGATGEEVADGELHGCQFPAGHDGEHKCYCGMEAPQVQFSQQGAARVVVGEANENMCGDCNGTGLSRVVPGAYCGCSDGNARREFDRQRQAATEPQRMTARRNQLGTWQALGAVSQERQAQVEKWGEQRHTLDRWNTILGEEIGEIAHALNEMDIARQANPGTYPSDEAVAHLRMELVQAAAVAVAWIEHIDSIA